MSGRSKRVLLLILIGALVCCEGWRTELYVRAWRSNLTLWSWAAADGSRKPRVWVNLGGALASVGRWADAGICFERAIEAADAATVLPWDKRTATTIASADLASLRINYLIP